jgi:hypothetical protein
MDNTLIARLDASPEGSRELDGEIALRLGLPAEFFGDTEFDGPECFDGQPIWAGGGRSFEAIDYTTSISAARSLLPDGKAWGLLVDDDGKATVYFWPDSQHKFDLIEGEIATAATAELAICIAAVKVDTAAILVDTGTTIPALLPAALVGGRMDADVGAISTSTAAADKLEESCETMLLGTVSGTPTTTTAITDISVTDDDQFKGRILIFRTATDAGLVAQATDITACTASTNTLTFTALTVAPTSGDTVIIV